MSRYSYGAYGDIETSTQTVAQPYRYTGREYDAETGLYHYRARAYDADTGRFLQEDPIWFEANDLNIYRYTWNNPTNWTDPSGMTAGMESGGLMQMALRVAAPAARIGNAISCRFGQIAGVLNVIPVGTGEAAVERTIETFSTVANGMHQMCGARAVFKKFRITPCGKRRVIGMVTRGFSMLAGNHDYFVGKSFTGDTLVLTATGYRPIREIEAGDKVAAMDELTGRVVWRKVLETYQRVAPGTLTLTVEDADGNIEELTTTPEHPFHVEEWDGKLDTLAHAIGLDGPSASATKAANDNEAYGPRLAFAASEGVALLDGHAQSRLFPTEGTTPFGTWVKAGALKTGDTLSTRFSIETANDNDPVAAPAGAPLTLRSIQRDDTERRVYNFAVQSLNGELTHNYLVGDAEWWTHNTYTFGQLRKAYEKACSMIPGGCKGMRRGKAKWGSPMRGDGRCGIRLDPADKRRGPYINVWDWRGGKRGKGGLSDHVDIK